jgi:hypothetical protein
MIIEELNYLISAEDADAFTAVYRRAGRCLTECEACIEWELRRCRDAPDLYVARITWSGTDGLDDDWHRDARLDEFQSILAPFADSRLDRLRFDAIDNG